MQEAGPDVVRASTTSNASIAHVASSKKSRSQKVKQPAKNAKTISTKQDMEELSLESVMSQELKQTVRSKWQQVSSTVKHEAAAEKIIDEVRKKGVEEPVLDDPAAGAILARASHRVHFWDQIALGFKSRGSLP